MCFGAIIVCSFGLFVGTQVCEITLRDETEYKSAGSGSHSHRDYFIHGDPRKQKKMFYLPLS